MSTLRDARRWRCKSCETVTLEPALLTAPSPFCDTFELTGCPKCKDCQEGFALLCDETACKQEASCGWPTGDKGDAWGGYRQTCYVHRENAQRAHGIAGPDQAVAA